MKKTLYYSSMAFDFIAMILAIIFIVQEFMNHHGAMWLIIVALVLNTIGIGLDFYRKHKYHEE